MTGTRITPIHVEFDMGYGNVSDAVLSVIEDTPEVTRIKVHDGSFDGRLCVEMYIEKGIDTPEFIDDFFLRIQRVAQLPQKCTVYSGVMYVSDGYHDEFWIMEVRPAPTT